MKCNNQKLKISKTSLATELFKKHYGSIFGLWLPILALIEIMTEIIVAPGTVIVK